MSDFQDAFDEGKNSKTLPILPSAVTEQYPAAHVELDGEGNEKFVSFERLLTSPSSKRSHVKVFDENSFSEYLGAYQGKGTVVFTDAERRIIVSVLDHHQPDGAAGWGRFRVELVTRLSAEWKAWTAMSGQSKSQHELAAFIENHLRDIAAPDGADLLEVVKRMQLARAVSFQSAVNLDTGEVQVRYNDEAQVIGTFVVPTVFVLALRPFEGAPLVRVDTRLRYRLSDGKLTLWFELIEVDKILEQCFRERVARIQADDGATRLMWLEGEPPAIVEPLTGWS